MDVGVLASGSGSILAALIAADLPIGVVVVDRPCRALEIAREAGLEAVLLERSDFGPTFDREHYTKELVEVLVAADVGLIAMAGFGTVLSEAIHAAFPSRVLNTHPALLPAFKGWHAVEEALSAGVKLTGCTVHLATLEVDAGPILAQEAVPVLANDDVSSLHERIKTVERRLYPATVRRCLELLEKGEEIT